MAKKAPTTSTEMIMKQIDNGKAPNVILLYGPDVVKLNNAKDAIVKNLIPEQDRAQNLKEYYSSGNRPLALQNIMNDVIDDLMTVPMMFKTRKAVVIYDLKEFRASKRGDKKDSKKSENAVDRMIKLIDRLDDSNFLVFVFAEDGSKDKTVSKTKKLYKKISSDGAVLEFSLPMLIFKFLDSLLGRNASQAMSLYKDLKESGQEPISLFRFLINQLRLIYQARILLSKSERRMSDEYTFLNAFEEKRSELPADGRYNILTLKGFRLKRLIDNSYNFTLTEFAGYYKKLLKLDIDLNPTQLDKYAVDPYVCFENFILDFCHKQPKR